MYGSWVCSSKLIYHAWSIGFCLLWRRRIINHTDMQPWPLADCLLILATDVSVAAKQADASLSTVLQGTGCFCGCTYVASISPPPIYLWIYQFAGAQKQSTRQLCGIHNVLTWNTMESLRGVVPTQPTKWAQEKGRRKARLFWAVCVCVCIHIWEKWGEPLNLWEAMPQGAVLELISCSPHVWPIPVHPDRWRLIVASISAPHFLMFVLIIFAFSFTWRDISQKGKPIGNLRELN